MKTIKSPDGVNMLLENMWLRHKAGLRQLENNIFMIELPPPTEEELAKARGDVHTEIFNEEDPDEFFGGWI